MSNKNSLCYYIKLIFIIIKVTLSQTQKKTPAHKQQLIDEIKDSVSKFSYVYVFSTDNMRNTALKEVRQEWNDSRYFRRLFFRIFKFLILIYQKSFFFGKNKIMSLALGKAPQDEIKQDIHKVSNHLQLQCGLLFTNRSIEETKE